MSKRTVWALAAAVVVVASGAVAVARSWEPYKFQGAATYKFRITQPDDEASQPILYSFDVRPAAGNAEDGRPQWRVTTTIERVMPQDEVESSAVFGMSPVLALAPTLMAGSPLFAGMLGQMDLSVGEKMSFFGAGRAEVTGKETVAGVEGFVCQLYMKQGEEMQRVAELVVNPDLAFPLRSRSYEDGQVKVEMLLLEYKKL
jgi:hypothetical protein